MFKRLTTFIALPVTVILMTVAVGCRHQADSSTPVGEGSPSQTTAEPSPVTAFERDLRYVRNSQFSHIWVFSRKDGQPLDKDDAAYLRTNAPQVVDWVTTDEGKKVLAGTNFDLELGGLNLLRKRFVVEDYTGK